MQGDFRHDLSRYLVGVRQRILGKGWTWHARPRVALRFTRGYISATPTGVQGEGTRAPSGMAPPPSGAGPRHRTPQGWQ